VHPHGHRLQGLRLQQRRQVLGTEWLVHGSASVGSARSSAQALRPQKYRVPRWLARKTIKELSVSEI